MKRDWNLFHSDSILQYDEKSEKGTRISWGEIQLVNKKARIGHPPKNSLTASPPMAPLAPVMNTWHFSNPKKERRDIDSEHM